jgi:2-polyprenyl-3-methyl-5-hydroxy-6-metoxy-1,4-benzoquinol methylase
MSKFNFKGFPQERRTGDTINIEGDYQYNAYYSPKIIQRFWHQSKSRLIQSLLPPIKGDLVLDVGCGSGVITNFLGSFGATAIGIDSNPGAIQFATRKFANQKIGFSVGLVDDEYKFQDPIDKIYCLEVIEHIHYFQGKDMVESFNKLLKPGGMVYLTTPNYWSLWPIIERIFDLIHVTPKMAGDQHVEFYNIKKLETLCRDAGFTINQTYITHIFAPWISLISWNLAVALESFESRLHCPLGLNLIIILKKT